MKKLQLLFALILFSASSAAFAEYACPAASSTGGGWSPPECSQTQTQTPAQSQAPAQSGGYSCPAADNTSGGWTPLECSPRQVACADCGTVESVNKVETEEATGLGAVAGAVAGGLLGHQVGKGKGKTLATVVGAVAGGVGGHYGEKLLRKKTRWDVIVLMQDATHRLLSFDNEPGYKAGDKVKINGTNLIRQ